MFFSITFVLKLSPSLPLYCFGAMPPKPKTKIKSTPGKGKAKVKPKKRRLKKKVIQSKNSKVKSSIPKSKTGPAFPLESGPTPSQMKPTDITRLYKIPDDRFETEGDVISHNGYMLEEKVTIDCICY